MLLYLCSLCGYLSVISELLNKGIIIILLDLQLLNQIENSETYIS